jgi:hypothetical protein
MPQRIEIIDGGKGLIVLTVCALSGLFAGLAFGLWVGLSVFFALAALTG